MILHDLVKGADSGLSTINDDELATLQKILLMMLDDLIDICNRYHLHFVLIGGSAIGALRHKGFVPWDDDIDLAMPRKDVNKLIKIIKKKYSKKYDVLDPSEKQNYGRVVPQVFLKGTKYKTVLQEDLELEGIFIDIFVIENIPDNIIARYFQGFMAMFCGYALSCRRLYKWGNYFKHLELSTSLKIKGRIGFFFSFASLEQWARWTNFWNSCCKNTSSKYISIPSDEKHYFGGMQKRAEFCNYKEISFEGRKCYLPGNYDAYLKDMYGNYMDIPSEEKRVRDKCIVFNPGVYNNL